MSSHSGKELSYTLAVDAFDTSGLPEDAREPGTDTFRKAVSKALADDFAPFGGFTRIVVDAREITVIWAANGQEPQPIDTILGLLRRGEYLKAMPLLRALLRVKPDDADVLYNLGMLLSDQGELEEAALLLQKLVRLQPSHVNGAVALSVVLSRQQRWAEAIDVARSALVQQPNNPWAHQNLGGFLLNQGELTEAQRHLRRASELDPLNQQAAYGLAQAVHRTGDIQAADQLYAKAMAINPRSPIAELAQEGRTRIAHETAKNNVDGGLRFDAVMYYVGAMERFEGMTHKEIQQIAVEIGILGMGGLQINDSAQKYTLRSLPGNFSGLHLMCLMYAGFKIVQPSLPLHMEEEYKEAKQLYELQKGRGTGEGSNT